MEVVDRENRKIRAADVGAVLRDEGHDLSAQSVSNALHCAAHRANRIKPAQGRGMYAPLSFEEERFSEVESGPANGRDVLDQGCQSDVTTARR